MSFLVLVLHKTTVIGTRCFWLQGRAVDRCVESITNNFLKKDKEKKPEWLLEVEFTRDAAARLGVRFWSHKQQEGKVHSSKATKRLTWEVESQPLSFLSLLASGDLMVSPLELTFCGPCKTAPWCLSFIMRFLTKVFPLYCTWTTNLTSLPSWRNWNCIIWGFIFSWCIIRPCRSQSARKKYICFYHIPWLPLIHFFIYSFTQIFAYWLCVG